MKYGKGILFAFIILAVLELVVRLTFTDNVSGRFEYGYHPTAGFVERGDTLHLVRAGGRRLLEQSFPIEKEAGKIRMVSVGGSVPRGPSLEASYSFQVGSILKDQGVPAESFNLAIGGFGSRRKHITLNASLKYQPDFALIHLNHSNEFEDEREYKRSQEFKKLRPKNIIMRSFIIRRLYELKTQKIFWSWLPEDIRRYQAVTDFDMEVRARMNKGQVEIWNRQVADMLDKDIRASLAAGARVIIIVQSSWRPDEDGVSTLVRFDHLETLAASHASQDVRVVSMYDAFQGTDPKEYFADPSHLRASGHKLIAQRIASEILNLLDKE